MPKKERTLTLRQRLRLDAEKKLDRILHDLELAADQILDRAKTGLVTWDLLHLAGSKQNKSLRAHMVTKLANEAELELERLYNNQAEMNLEEVQGAVRELRK